MSESDTPSLSNGGIAKADGKPYKMRRSRTGGHGLNVNIKHEESDEKNKKYDAEARNLDADTKGKQLDNIQKIKTMLLSYSCIKLWEWLKKIPKMKIFSKIFFYLIFILLGIFLCRIFLCPECPFLNT